MIDLAGETVWVSRDRHSEGYVAWDGMPELTQEGVWVSENYWASLRLIPKEMEILGDLKNRLPPEEGVVRLTFPKPKPIAQYGDILKAPNGVFWIVLSKIGESLWCRKIGNRAIASPLAGFPSNYDWTFHSEEYKDFTVIGNMFDQGDKNAVRS